MKRGSAVLFFSLAVAACGESPAAVTTPATASYEGGWTAGSGSRDSASATITNQNADTPECAPDALGGGWTGSGSITTPPCSETE